MSTIGVGKAFRDQDREARRRRERARASFELVRERRSDAAEAVHGSEDCAGCGLRVPATEVLWTDGGPLCEGCVRDAVLSAEMPAPSRGLSVGAVSAWGVVALEGAVALSGGPGLLGGKGGVGWPLFAAMAVVGAFGAMVDAATIRGGGPSVAVQRGVAAAMLLLAVLAGAWPYL